MRGSSAGRATRDSSSRVLRREQGGLEPQQPHVAKRVGETLVIEKRLALGQLELDKPADVQVSGRSTLRQAGDPKCRLGRCGAKRANVPLQPAFQIVMRDGSARVTPNRELSHGPNGVRRSRPPVWVQACIST